MECKKKTMYVKSSKKTVYSVHLILTDIFKDQIIVQMNDEGWIISLNEWWILVLYDGEFISLCQISTQM